MWLIIQYSNSLQDHIHGLPSNGMIYSAVLDQIRPLMCFQFLTNMIPSAAEPLCKPSVSHTEIQRYCCQHQQQAIFSKLQGICACVHTGVYTHVQAWWWVTRFCWSERYSGDTAVQLNFDTVEGTSATNATMTSTWAELERAFQVLSPYVADLDGWQINKPSMTDGK